jgi:hypothetical protein
LGSSIITGKSRKSSSVLSLALAFVDITLHRRGPDELPASRFLLSVLIGLYLLTSLIGIWTLGVLDSGAAQLLLFDSVFFLAYVFVALRLFRHDRRYPQTVIALLGTEVVINIVGLPLALWSRSISVPPDPYSVPMLLHLVLLLWWIDVAGFILSRAISRPYFVGVLFVIVYVLTSYRISTFLFPPAS